MMDFIHGMPWAMFGVGYVGLLVYLLKSVADPSDESLTSVKEVFTKHGRTTLTAALVVPVLVIAARDMDQLNMLAAFSVGYMNTSLLKSATDGWASRASLTKGP